MCGLTILKACFLPVDRSQDRKAILDDICSPAHKPDKSFQVIFEDCDAKKVEKLFKGTIKKHPMWDQAFREWIYKGRGLAYVAADDRDSRITEEGIAWLFAIMKHYGFDYDGLTMGGHHRVCYTSPGSKLGC